MQQLKQIDGTASLDGLESRQDFLRILFVHRSLADIKRCLHELKPLGITVASEVVVSPSSLPIGCIRCTLRLCSCRVPGREAEVRR